MVAIFNMPYNYYTMLRFIVFGVSAYGAYFAYQQSKQVWVWAYLIVAILFNPLIPFYLSKTTWIVLDLLVLVVYVVSLFNIKSFDVSTDS